MPRPTDQAVEGARSGGFGPTPGASENLGQIDVSTIHQLDVDGASANAKALAAVFDKGASLATKVANEKVTQDQQNAQTQGELDGTNGTVDQSRTGTVMGVAGAYATGVKRAQTQLAAYQTAEKARALFASNPAASLMDTQDDKGNKVPGLLTQVDQLFASAFPGGAEKDPTIANILAPIMQHTMNELTHDSYQHKIMVDQQTAEDSTQAAFMFAMKNGDPSTVNIPNEMDKLTKVYGSNPRAARDALVHAIGEAAVSTANPNAITQFLPPNIDFGNGATLTPENQQYLDSAKNRALEAQTRGNHVVAQQMQNNIADAMLAGKDPMAMLHDYLKMPGANGETALSMFNWYYRRGKEREADSVDNNAHTWEMDKAIAKGDITNGGQLISQLTDWGLSNTKAGNQLLNRGMSAIRQFQNTNADDPDFRAGLSAISAHYNPAQDPIFHKIMNQSAEQQQAGAMYDYRVLYNQFIKNVGTSSADASRKAMQAVKDKWGDSVEDSSGKLRTGNFKPPANETEMAAIVRNSVSDANAFHAAGITSRDLDVLRDSGYVSEADAARGYQLLINKHKQ